MPGSFLALSLYMLFLFSDYNAITSPTPTAFERQMNLIRNLNFTPWINTPTNTCLISGILLYCIVTLCYNVCLIMKANLESMKNLYVCVPHIQQWLTHNRCSMHTSFFQLRKAPYISRTTFKILLMRWEEESIIWPSTYQHSTDNSMSISYLFEDGK